jgi:F-type H+-transporting ATPase subunit b
MSKMAKTIRIAFLAAVFLMASGLLFSQSGSQTSAAAADQAAAVTTQAPAAGQMSVQQQAAASAANEVPENTDEEENAQFKYSSIVRFLAGKLGVPKEAVYWGFLVINFGILMAGVVWLVRKMMPHGFAPRTAEIRKALDEARRVSAEANTRLSEIEGRLARLDSEISSIRAAAEADFSVEEQRIKADAERDGRHVVAMAEQEISAAARSAQRDLKAFAASLAVDLAEKKIRVDETTDQALVRRFASQLGKDGQ